MDGTKTALERAFELARSGRLANITELRRALKEEGFNASHLDGPALKRQLMDLLRAAKAPSSSAKTQVADSLPPKLS